MVGCRWRTGEIPMRFGLVMLIASALAGVGVASTTSIVSFSLNRDHSSEGVWKSLPVAKDVSGAIKNDATSTRAIELYARHGLSEEKLGRILPGQGMTFRATSCTNLRVAIVLAGMEPGKGN